MNGTYHPILTTRILGDFQRITGTVGNNGESVHSVILDTGNGGVGVRGIMVNGRNDWICVYWKFLLRAGS